MNAQEAIKQIKEVSTQLYFTGEYTLSKRLIDAVEALEKELKKENKSGLADLARWFQG